MNRIRCSLIILLVVMGTATGCVSHSMTTPEQVTPSSQLRLSFEPPREVILETEEGDTLVLEGVTELRGRWIESTADSLTISPSIAKFASGSARQLGLGATASVAIADLRMDEIGTHRGKTVAAVIGIGLVIALLVFMATSSSNPPPTNLIDNKGIY